MGPRRRAIVGVLLSGMAAVGFVHGADVPVTPPHKWDVIFGGGNSFSPDSLNALSVRAVRPGP